MTRPFKPPTLVAVLNGGFPLHSPWVQVVNADALQWLEEHAETWDFIVVDFPDLSTSRWASSIPPPLSPF